MKHHTPPALAHLGDALEALEAAHRLRRRAAPLAHGDLSFSSNDYLGLASEPVLPGASGASASRLVAGERTEHVALEVALASWCRTEGALLFTSGYAANVGLLSALLGPEDLVVSDALNHASIIDGIRLARAHPVVVPHLDAGAVEEALRSGARKDRRAWVVTESYFSMDADSPDLAALRALCDRHGAGLLVDEAHALGVLGPEGKGMAAAAGVVPEAVVGTLGKAFGASGAFVLGCQTLIDWLWNRARSFVFSTGTSPALAATGRARLAQAQAEPWRRERAIALAKRLRTGLRALGHAAPGHGPIVPWILGSEPRALQAAKALGDAALHAVAIRPPTVPPGTSRIRFAMTARHREEDVDAVLAVARKLA